MVLPASSNCMTPSAVQLGRGVDDDNSTTTSLGNGGIFTGAWVETLGWASAVININTNQASATDGFEIQSSTDAVNVTHIHSFTVPINSTSGTHYVFTLVERYYRIKYTNGTTPQTSFNLSSTLTRYDATHTHTHPIEYTIDGNHEAQLMRSVLVAKKPNDDYTNIEATTGGNLKVSIEETEPTADTPEFFEDTSFVTGDSPVTLDFNTALGRNSTEGYVINDGAGNFTISFSTDGVAFGDEITMKKNEIISWEDISVDSLRVTWVADSAYRASAI